MSLLEELSPGAATEERCHVHVLTDRCAGCQECIVRCPAGALHLDVERWIARADEDLCVGCRQCVRTCPFSAITVSGPVLVAPPVERNDGHRPLITGDARETHGGFASWDEALAEADRCLACPDPTCVRGCPAHNDIPGFISALRAGDLDRAHRVLRETTVLPDVCSRVCNQAAQCEGACSWALAGENPVAIGRLERFVADHLAVPPPDRRGSLGEGLSVAVIGAGPAGIGAAWRLTEEGARVTVYEKEAEPGGLLGWGIPDFTLPGPVADRAWRQLRAAGVELRCGTEIDADSVAGLLAAYDAVIVSVGASQPMRLPVPGADLEGVVDATLFLQGAKGALRPGGDPDAFRGRLGLPAGGQDGSERPHVLVLGAGNTAMDVARSARRLGLAATCVDWLDERFALTRPDELAEARREGVTVSFSRTLVRLTGTGRRVEQAELATTRQDRADRSPKVRRGHTEVLPVDLVVMAMGYRIEPAYTQMFPGIPVRPVSKGTPDRRWSASGILSPDAEDHGVGKLALTREARSMEAARPVRHRVWVTGDALVGPSTVVEAMTQGRLAAGAVLASRT